MVKALDSNTSAVFQTCSHAARAGPRFYALSDQLTGRDRPRFHLAAGGPGLAAQGSATRECSSPHMKCGRGFESHS